MHRADDVRVFHKECTSLAEAGFKITLIACKGRVSGPCEVQVVTLPEMGSRIRRMLVRSYLAYRSARNILADVYHFHDPELLPYGLLLKVRTGARVVYDSHECYPEDIRTKEWLPVWLRGAVSWAFKLLEDFVSRRLDLVVAATPHIEERFKGIARSTLTINNYPRLKEFDGAAGDLFGVRDGVCYVGSISIVRGFMPFLDSLDKVPQDVAAYVAGPFSGPEVERLARQHRNWSRVTYFGTVARDEVAKIYNRSFAGIVNFLPAPNHLFSQPNKLFEYMAAGIPVICSNFDLWRDIVDVGGCGICVDPASADEIAEAINRLLFDVGLREKMAFQGRTAITTKFSWEFEAEKLVDAYRALCEQA